MKTSLKLTIGTFVLFTFCFLLSTSKVNAETYCDTPTDLGNCYVDGENGLDTNDGKTPETAWATITKAATLVDDGDTVNVKGGITYNEINVIPTNSGSAGNYITFQAWPTYGTPILNSDPLQEGFYIDEKNYIIISDFEVKNALDGLYIFRSSFVTVKNCIIHTYKAGGIGIYIDYRDIYTDVKVYNNVFYDNWRGVNYDSSSGAPVNFELYNNICTNNFVGIYSDQSEVDIDYNNVWDNDTDYGNLAVAGLHDISTDPLFIDPANYNFHLNPNSPSINTGTTLSDVPLDILGVPRPQETGYDMGAYEYYDIFVFLNPLSPDPTDDNTPTLTGLATSAHISTISYISYSVDGGPWITDGVSGTIHFTINLPELSSGSHTILVRATDSYGNVSDASLYGSDTFVVSTSIDNLTETGSNIFSGTILSIFVLVTTQLLISKRTRVSERFK